MNLKVVGSQVMILVLTITNLKCPVADLGGGLKEAALFPYLQPQEIQKLPCTVGPPLS